MVAFQRQTLEFKISLVYITEFQDNQSYTTSETVTQKKKKLN